MADDTPTVAMAMPPAPPGAVPPPLPAPPWPPSTTTTALSSRAGGVHEPTPEASLAIEHVTVTVVVPDSTQAPLDVALAGPVGTTDASPSAARPAAATAANVLFISSPSPRRPPLRGETRWAEATQPPFTVQPFAG